MRVAAPALLLLSACFPGGTGPWLMVSIGSEGAVVWRRFPTLEACERGKREADIEMLCAIRGDLEGRYRLIE